MNFPSNQFSDLFCWFSFPRQPSRFRFNINAWLCLNHFCMVTFLHSEKKLETQIFHQFSFPNFSIGSVSPVTRLRFCFNIYVWLRIKHLCVVAFLHFIQESAKKKSNRLTHLWVAVVNRLGNSSSHQRNILVLCSSAGPSKVCSNSNNKNIMLCRKCCLQLSIKVFVYVFKISAESIYRFAIHHFHHFPREQKSSCHDSHLSPVNLKWEVLSK